MDRVDEILEQWHRERPDLDVTAMGLIGRIIRLTQHLSREMGKTFAQHDLNSAKFDLLATLRRSGEPYSLSPGDLMAATMVTSGTMTNRIDQLEKTGLVKRIPNPEDGRGFLISLTAEGLNVIDAALNDHVQTQARLTEGLSPEEHELISGLLRKYLSSFEGEKIRR